MVGDFHMLVGLMVHWVEHHGDNSGAVDVDRDGHKICCEFEVLEQVHEPLGLFRCMEQSRILGVIGARGDIRVQLGVPGAEPRRNT